MDLRDWIDRAKPVERPVLEVGFIVWDDFYYGPENGWSAEQWNTLREPLYRPALEIHRDRVDHVFTSVLEAGRVDELVRHYADLFRVAAKHGRTPSPSHFWLTPYIFSPGEFEIPFAYHETREDAERLFDALEKPGDGEIYDDAEQGWELTIVASGDRLFIRHADFETQREHACIACDRQALVRQTGPLRARLDRILADLRQALGADYWSLGRGE